MITFFKERFKAAGVLYTILMILAGVGIDRLLPVLPKVFSEITSFVFLKWAATPIALKGFLFAIIVAVSLHLIMKLMFSKKIIGINLRKAFDQIDKNFYKLVIVFYYLVTLIIVSAVFIIFTLI